MRTKSKQFSGIFCLIIAAFLAQNLYPQAQTQALKQESAKTTTQQQEADKSGSAGQSSEQPKSEVVSKEEIIAIREEISNLLLKNHYDKIGAIALVDDFEKWIDSFDYQFGISGKDFARKLQLWFREKTQDRHYIFLEVGMKASGAVRMAEGSGFGPEENHGLSELRWYPGFIGYMKYKAFNPGQNPDARQVIDLAMSFFEKAHSIIIDLRENPGGGGDMAAYLISYFLPEDSLPLCQTEQRYNETEKSFIEYSYRKLPAPRLKNRNVFLLTSGKTASAAERFTYYFKSRDIGTIVGENTSGATHGMSTFPVATRFTFGLPYSRTLDMVNKQDTEVKGGIVPDVVCPEKEALEKALELIRSGGRFKK